MNSERMVLDLKRQVWSPSGQERAHTDLLSKYVIVALDFVGDSQIVVITGSAPTWLYLAVAHALAISGTCKKLVYNSPSSGDVLVFDYGGKKTCLN